jgi:hypothetical protein
MRQFYLVVLLVLIWIFSPTPSSASWLIYHKPAFSGRIIDAETKAPIEGAVVVAIYYKEPIIGGPGGVSVSVLKIREALTDVKGVFSIPSYTTLIQPFSLGLWVDFIIYKRGYKSDLDSMFPLWFLGPEYLFSRKPLGTKEKMNRGGKTATITAKTKDERRRASMIDVTGVPESKWPLLREMIEREDEWLRKTRTHGGVD